MANLNKVMLIGNLTRDPELSFLPSQTPVCELGLAVNRTWTGQDGVKKEEVTWVDCSAFGRQAETIAKYLKKGAPIFIEGRLKLDQWQAQDGTKKSKMRVVIEGFQFLGGPRPGGAPGQAPAGDAEMPEYGGEPTTPPRPQQQARPAYQPRPAGRPAPQQQQPAQPAPNYDAGDSMPEDAAPPISGEDIPF